MMRVITDVQRKAFLQYLNDYIAWNDIDEGKKNMQDHREHQRYFQERLSKNAIQTMDEAKFREVYKGLWASNIWGNKDWYVENKLLKPNKDLSFIKSELTKLFHDDNLPLAPRYNEFKKNIKGLGSSALTELLHFVYPDKYCLWNDKPKTVLPFLGLDSLLPDKVFKYQIADGEEYALCNEVMDLLRQELIQAGIKNADFIDLDCYLWFIFSQRLPKRKRGRPEEVKEVAVAKIRKETLKIETHEDAEYFMLKLGEMLGYITYTCDKKSKSNNVELGEAAMLKDLPAFAGERDMGFARYIDVIWFNEDENPLYCIEVEHTTNVVNSLTKLHQLGHFRVNFFVIASEDKRSKFETEMGKAPYRSEKDRYHFISYDELISLYESGDTFFKLKNKLCGE